MKKNASKNNRYINCRIKFVSFLLLTPLLLVFYPSIEHPQIRHDSLSLERFSIARRYDSSSPFVSTSAPSLPPFPFPFARRILLPRSISDRRKNNVTKKNVTRWSGATLHAATIVRGFDEGKMNSRRRASRAITELEPSL